MNEHEDIKKYIEHCNHDINTGRNSYPPDIQRRLDRMLLNEHIRNLKERKRNE